MHMALLDGPRELYFTRILLRTIKEAWHTSEATEPRGSAARDSAAGPATNTSPERSGRSEHVDGIFDFVDRTHRRHGAFSSITCSSRIGR